MSARPPLLGGEGDSICSTRVLPGVTQTSRASAHAQNEAHWWRSPRSAKRTYDEDNLAFPRLAHCQTLDRWFGKDRLVRFHDEAMVLRVPGHAHIGYPPKGLPILGPQKIFQALRISYR